MPKEKKSEIVFVVDRSGSMADIREDMIGGFKTFVDEQRKIPGECAVTLARFDDDYEVVYQGKPLADVPPLELVPRGSTALLDAIGRTVQSTGERLAKMPDAERPSKVIVVVITDGQENASREYDGARVKQQIAHQRDKYGWDFIFLGADESAVSVARGLNINNAANFVRSKRGSAALYSSVSASVGAARSHGRAVAYNQADYDAHNKKP